MSLPMEINCTCSVCGKESEQVTLASTNRFGAPDLDMRPPEMMRSTMVWWLQECPHCGYVAEDIEEPGIVGEDWLKSEYFMGANHMNFISPLALKFYKQYLICLEAKDCPNAFSGIFHAAWACDDTDDVENAVNCRKIGIELLDVLISTYDEDDEFNVFAEYDMLETYNLVRMDLLRRTNQFSRVTDEYSDFEFSSGTYERVRKFQLALAQQGDNRCHRVSECPEN